MSPSSVEDQSSELFKPKLALGGPSRVGGSDLLSISRLMIEIVLRLLFIGIVFFIKEVPISVQQIREAEWHKYSYPFHEKSTITAGHLRRYVLVGSMIPVVLILCSYLILFLLKSRVRKSMLLKSMTIDIIKILMAESLSYLMAYTSVHIIKRWVGRLRPDFLGRCRPLNFDINHPDFSVLGLVPFCTNKNIKTVLEGRVSFMSGHAAFSAAVMAVVALYLYHEFPSPLAIDMGGWKPTLALVAMWPVFYCSATRVIDHRHHPTDVLAGVLVGTVAAFLSYNVYYRPTVPEKKEQEYSFPNALDRSGAYQPIYSLKAVD